MTSALERRALFTCGLAMTLPLNMNENLLSVGSYWTARVIVFPGASLRRIRHHAVFALILEVIRLGPEGIRWLPVRVYLHGHTELFNRVVLR